MSQNQQTVFLRTYLTADDAKTLEVMINDDLDALRAEGVKLVRFFVKHWLHLETGLKVAYLTAYIQRPKPKEESPSAHLDAVLDDAGEWEPVDAVGDLSV